jgi:hypothetical protein
MICPKCKEDRARRTERVNAVDHIANRFFFKPYSCHSCQHRFYALRQDVGMSAMRAELTQRFAGARLRKNHKRNKREFLIYVFAALAIIAMIYYLAQQRA